MLLQNNRFIRGKLHMNFKNKWIIPLLLLVTIGLVGCSNGNNKQGSKASNTQTSQKSQVLSGVYKISDKDSDTDDNGNKQPGYYYFKKNGEVLWAQNETGDENNGNYGGAARGTWKPLGNNMFKIHIKYIFDNDEFTFKARKTGNKLHTYSNSKNAKYEWDADDNYKQPDMTYSDFMEIFNNGKNSQRQKVQENGYDDPDNNSSSDSDDSSNIDPKTLGILILEKARGAESINTGDIEYMIMGKKNDYQIGFGTKDGTLNYVIDGDQVTVRDGSYDYSDDSAKTYSIKDLVNEYYNSSSDKSKVDSVASEVNTTDMSDQ